MSLMSIVANKIMNLVTTFVLKTLQLRIKKIIP